MEQIANSCGLNSQEIVCVFLCCYGLCKYIVEVFLATARSLHISFDNLDVHDEINFGVRQVREIVSHGGQFSRFCCSPRSAVGLLICTLISENQGLFRTLEKFQVLYLNLFFQFSPLEKIQVPNRKKLRFAEPQIFLWFEINLNFSRP